MRARLSIVFALVFTMFCAMACGRTPSDATPEGAVEAFLRALDDAPRDPTASARAYALLNADARKALDARAARASSIEGHPATPESMLAPVWSPPRFAVETTKTKTQDEMHAVVDVFGVDPATQHASVPVVKEGTAWRIVVVVPP
jgi:hypothetical protein